MAATGTDITTATASADGMNAVTTIAMAFRCRERRLMAGSIQMADNQHLIHRSRRTIRLARGTRKSLIMLLMCMMLLMLLAIIVLVLVMAMVVVVAIRVHRCARSTARVTDGRSGGGCFIDRSGIVAARTSHDGRMLCMNVRLRMRHDH